MSAGQKKSSANIVLPPRELDEVAELPLEPLHLRRDDQHVSQKNDENHEICRRHILLGSAHAPGPPVESGSRPRMLTGLRRRLTPLTARCSPGPYVFVLCPPASRR